MARERSETSPIVRTKEGDDLACRVYGILPGLESVFPKGDFAQGDLFLFSPSRLHKSPEATRVHRHNLNPNHKMQTRTIDNWRKQMEKLRVFYATFGVTKEAWVDTSPYNGNINRTKQVGATIHCFTLGEYNLQLTETHLLVTVAAEDDAHWWPSGVMIFELGGAQ